MKSIGTNQQIFDYLSAHKLWIGDSTIQQINITRDEYYIKVEITLKLKRREKLLRLCFEKAKSFYFNSDDDFMLQEVAHCKFFISGGTVYLSLDPYNEDEVIDDRDNDVVQSPIVNGFISE